MSRSDWGIILATVGVVTLAVILALSLNPKQPNLTGNVGYQERPADYHAGGYDCQPAQLKLLTGRERLRQEASCADPKQNDRYNADNLIQYRRAADAADASAILSYKQTGIAAVGAGLGLITMFAAIGAAWYARDAARQGRRGAKAAEDTLENARETAERQDRAYIAVQPGGVNRTKDGHAVGDVIVKNVGKIPAHQVSTIVRMRTENTKEIETFKVSQTWRKDHRTIQPGDNIRRSSTEAIAVADLVKDNTYIFVWGVIYYSDGFGNRRFTRFCHRYPSARVRFEVKDLMPTRPGGHLMRDYADMLIDPENARHHQYGNDAD